MKAIAADLPAIVFMKVGRHSGEDLKPIIARKMEEFEQTGMIFWGYGGGTMHPIQRVQPFARMMIEQGVGLTLVMQPIDSHHPDRQVVATEYSRDGAHWEPIPRGIEVRGSRYALVLGEILPGDLEIDLAQYRVGAGPSAGRIASDYVQGRVDKACLQRAESPAGGAEPHIITVAYAARLNEPYAVLLK